MSVAALAVGLAGYTPDGVEVQDTVDQLNLFAHSRAWPGGVQMDGRDLPHEAAEELADCRSYLVWEIQSVLPGALEGIDEDAERYERAMRSLSHILLAWDALYRL